MKSVKEILRYLKDSETEDLIRQVQRGIPVRLPNSDFDLEDPREMIDFPCANNWQDYYHGRGMTPRHSLEYRGMRPDYKAFHLKKSQRARGVEM